MRKVVIRVDRKHSAIQNAAIILDQGKQQMIFILLFAVLYLLRDLGGANIPDIVISGLCAVAFIVMDIGTSLGMYVFTTALTVPHNEIVIVYMAVLIGKVLASGQMRISGKMLLLNLGMLLLQLVNITLFSRENVNNAIYDYVTRMLFIIVPLFWYHDEYSAEDFQSALLCYAAGVILGGTVTMILAAESVTWEVLLKGTGGYRLGKTYNTESGMQTSYNANQLATMCAIAASIFLQHMDTKRISKLFGFVLLGYSLFLVVLTRSRTGLLLMAMAVIIYYLTLVVRRKKLLAGIFLLGAICAVVFAVITFVPGVVEAVIERFVDQEDISNGRIDQFVFYIQKWIENPWCFFFGYGIGTYQDELGMGMSSHNAVADILISWGLMGMLLVVGIVGMCFGKGIKEVGKKDRAMALLPAMVALVASMAGQYLTVSYPHMRLCFLLLAAKGWEISDSTQKVLIKGNIK